MDPRSAEWLETDSLGGYASGPVHGPRTRRYQALLLSAVDPPTQRMVLVNGVEAWLERADRIVALTAQHYAPDVVSPALAAVFTATPWPRWVFTLPDGSRLEVEIFVAPDACETVLRWQPPPDCAWSLRVRPLISGRDHHALHHRNPVFDFRPTQRGGNVAWRPYPGVPAIAALTNGAYRHDPCWYENLRYAWETARGLDDTEDLASPGVFAFDLAGPAVMILRAGDGLAASPAAHAQALAAAERDRRQRQGPLAVAASSYLADRGTGRTVIAGYPWFTDWGRDSFIALRGLCLASGRTAEAALILNEWAGQVSQGMLPNRFPDAGGAPEYNAVDASLWFIVAVHDLHAATGHTQPRLIQAAEEILAGYRDGTRYGIRMEADGLLAAGVPGVQLTWMDAKYGDTVVTPRIGKPVEIQALWINALRIARQWAPHWAALADRAQSAFAARFANPAGGLFDVVDADHVPGRINAQLRPNQIFAVGGLPFPLLAGAPARAIVDLVEHKLLTPLGLRTLAPDDPAYRKRYAGTREERDGTYHQGTAWPFLLAPFIDAWLAVRGRTKAATDEAAARFLPPLDAHLAEDGIGHIAELVDGDPPHAPGGCPFQAWSMSAYLQIRAMLAS